MNTIAERRELIRKAMTEFEKKKTEAFIAGFYAMMVENLAVDKLSTFEDTLRTLKMSTSK